MPSFSLDDLKLPFELTENEKALSVNLISTLENAAEVSLKKLNELAVLSLKAEPPERIIRFLLFDSKLLIFAEYEKLKDYWKDYINTYQFIYSDFNDDYRIHNKNEGALKIGQQTYQFQLRKDLSYAHQAIALYCLIQDKSSPDEEIRHQWRMLAVKHGSLYAAKRATRAAVYYLLQTEQDFKIIKDTLDFLVETVMIHGSAALYFLSYFCTMVTRRFPLNIEYKPLLDCAYSALLLANQTFHLEYCQTSLRNMTFGSPDKFLEQNFSDKDIQNDVLRLKIDLGNTKVKIIEEASSKNPELLTKLFSKPRKSPSEISEFKSLLNEPKLM